MSKTYKNWLITYQRIRKSSNMNNIRRLLHGIQDHRCANCQKHTHLECHHIVPVADGGKTSLTNIVMLCEPCHRKADKVSALWRARHRKRADLSKVKLPTAPLR